MMPLKNHVCLCLKEWACCIERTVIHLMSKVSLQINFYMTCEDEVFVVNVVVTNPTWKTMAMTVIN